MGKRKLKITIVIAGIFLMCFVISLLVSDIIKKGNISAEAAGIEVSSDIQPEDNASLNEDDDISVTQTPAAQITEAADAADDADAGQETKGNEDATSASEPEETSVDEDSDDLPAGEKAADLTAEASTTKNPSDNSVNEEDASLSDNESESVNQDQDLIEEASDVIETTEDSYSTSASDADGLIGILSTPEWYEAIDIAPTCDYVIANVNEMLNVRAEPDKNAELIGKLPKDSYAKILERGDEWTKIESGNVVGYVYNTYLYMDVAALEKLSELDAYKVVVNVNVLNIREQPNTDCEVLGKSTAGDEFTYLQEISVDGWNAIQFDEDTIAYVSDEYSDVVIQLDTAVTIKEYEAALRAAAIAKALEESKKSKPAVVNREPIELSDEDIYLMSVVIAMEALSESHEGKLAVANVIINRMLDGYWGDTVSDVVYAPGQFTGANSGRVELYWNKVSKDCMDAAVEALAGYNNIDDYMFFITIAKAKFDKYSKYYVLGGHCFYERQW